MLLLFIVPLFLSPELVVEERVAVNAPPDTVWELVVDLERHALWHPWGLVDDAPRLVYGQTRRGLDASCFWIGARDNHGMLRYTRVDERRREIDGLLDLSSLGESRIAFRLTPREGGVEVTETFRRSAGLNVFRRWLHPVSRAKVARHLSENLSRLKAVAESAAAEGNPEGLQAP